MRSAPNAPGAVQRLGGLASLIDRGASWQHEARCRNHDAALFFGPNRFEPKRERLAREAKAKDVCATCPALVTCREYALANEELYGVWGGLSETDRRSVLAQRGSVARAG